MSALIDALFGSQKPKDYGVEYWIHPEKAGWLTKQGKTKWNLRP